MFVKYLSENNNDILLLAAFKIVKGWLGPEAISMLRFVNRNEIQDYISAEYLPPHMGGMVSIMLCYVIKM